MYLLYLDDSGSVRNQNESYFVLGGFSVYERQVHWLDNEMEKLASSISASNPHAIEFHASAIFSGKIPPWNGMTKEERKNIIKNVLNIIAQSHETTKVFSCAVHKKSFTGQDPIFMAFEEIANRFDILLARLFKSGDNQRGLIIIDRCDYETGLQKLALDFRARGTKWRDIKNLPEVPLFADSRSSRLIQIADHIAYAVFRYYESDDLSYFKIISSRFDSEGGKIHGLVHRQTNIPNCLCPACLSRKQA